MDFVIFGKSKTPDINFSVEPQRGGQFRIWSSTNYVVYGGDEEKVSSIDWMWLSINSEPELFPLPYEIYNDWGKFGSLLQETLIPITATKGERTFLDAYLKVSNPHSPALIPQAWVNWIHYSAHDSERAKRAKQEPFRIDFMMYSDHRKIVIEIDGSSHFSEIFDVDGTGRIRYEASMDKYTEHLRKDRWLRSKGWEVWRFSESEILDNDFDVSAVLAEMRIKLS